MRSSWVEVEIELGVELELGNKYGFLRRQIACVHKHVLKIVNFLSNNIMLSQKSKLKSPCLDGVTFEPYSEIVTIATEPLCFLNIHSIT